MPQPRLYDLGKLPKLSPAQERDRLTQMEAGRLARQLIGVTAQEAARMIGVDTLTLRRWEQGERLPTIANWRAYRRFLIEVLIAFATEDHIPSPDPALLIGTNQFRQRIGLPGHCARCAMVGHKAAHPRAKCRDVGCTQNHIISKEVVNGRYGPGGGGEDDARGDDHGRP